MRLQLDLAKWRLRSKQFVQPKNQPDTYLVSFIHFYGLCFTRLCLDGLVKPKIQLFAGNEDQMSDAPEQNTIILKERNEYQHKRAHLLHQFEARIELSWPNGLRMS